MSQAKAEAQRQLQREATTVVAVAKIYHGAVMGRQGQTRADIQSRTNTRIFIPPPTAAAQHAPPGVGAGAGASGAGYRAASDEIRITGPRDGVERAKVEILKIAEQQSRLDHRRLAVARKYHAWIRGPFDANMKMWSQKFAHLEGPARLQIHIPPAYSYGGEEHILVSGDKQAVEEVAVAIEQIVKEKA